MSAITNTTISSYDYLLRQCYSSNRNARIPYGRITMNAGSLAKVDSDALKKASRNLSNIEYSSDNGVNIYNNINIPKKSNERGAFLCPEESQINGTHRNLRLW